MLSTGALMVREWVVEAKTRQSGFGATRFPAIQKSSKRQFLRYRLKDRIGWKAQRFVSKYQVTSAARPFHVPAAMVPQFSPIKCGL